MKNPKGWFGIACLFFLVLIILSSNSVQAAPPFTTSNDKGYFIEPNLVEHIKEAQEYTFHVHVFNTSTGSPITSATSCYLDLYNFNGEQSFRGYTETIVDRFDYEFLVNAANFSNGQYQAKFQCNSSALGGSAEISFEVNRLGKPITLQGALMSILIYIVLFLIFGGLLILGATLPSNNQSDTMTGYVIAVSNLKYLKMFCLGVSYLMLVLLSYVSWMFVYIYMENFDFLASIFQFIFYALAIMTFILFPVMVYFVIANWVRDSKISDMLSRGLSVK